MDPICEDCLARDDDEVNDRSCLDCDLIDDEPEELCACGAPADDVYTCSVCDSPMCAMCHEGCLGICKACL